MNVRPACTPSPITRVLCAALVVLFIGSLARPARSQENAKPSPLTSRKLGGGATKGRGGATQTTEKAVLDGLRWLVRHQNPDGSWSATTLCDRCPCDEPLYNPAVAYSNRADVGVTALALLCFSGAGLTPTSRQDVVDTAMAKRHKIGDVVSTGIDWLVAKQRPNGSFCADRSYFHYEALACMAITDTYDSTKDPGLKESAQRALAFIESLQQPNPFGPGRWGWAAATRSEISVRNVATVAIAHADADMMTTAWCAAALASGVRAGLNVSPVNLAGCATFAKWISAENAGALPMEAKGAGPRVATQNASFVDHPAMTWALDACTRIFAEHDFDDPFLDVAAQQIAADAPVISADKRSVDFSYWYWGTLALNWIDGPDAPHKTNKYWSPWNDVALVNTLLASQDRTERACTNGGWMLADRWSADGGPVYTTAMSVLTLEVYDRFGTGFIRKPKPSVAPPREPK